jgi:hypothetical protein
VSELPHVFFQTVRDANGTQFKVEDLYQAFKARLVTELVAEDWEEGSDGQREKVLLNLQYQSRS